MILSKQYLNELKDKKKVTDSIPLNEQDMIEKRDNYDVFLSYSSSNREYAYMILQLLKRCGYSVYMDIFDKSLNPHKVDAKSARTLAKAMRKCQGLIYIHSSASTVSKWCPWELGYFSGNKDFMCANMPLNENKSDMYVGQEYLDIYKTVEFDKTHQTSKDEFWIFDQDRYYVSLREWLDGKWEKNRRKITP